MVFNTFFGLRSRGEQARTFVNVASRPTDDGVFVVEGAVPNLGRFPDSDQASVEKVDYEDVTLVDVSRLDREAQWVDSEQMCIRQTGVSVVKFATVYAYSDQLDTMANEVGLLLRACQRGWRGKTWRGEEDPFVAIYERGGQIGQRGSIGTQ